MSFSDPSPLMVFVQVFGKLKSKAELEFTQRTSSIAESIGRLILFFKGVWGLMFSRGHRQQLRVSGNVLDLLHEKSPKHQSSWSVYSINQYYFSIYNYICLYDMFPVVYCIRYVPRGKKFDPSPAQLSQVMRMTQPRLVIWRDFRRRIGVFF